jgi:hypothetical protein
VHGRHNDKLIASVVSPENWTVPYVKEAESLKGSEKRTQTYGNRATTAR